MHAHEAWDLLELLGLRALGKSRPQPFVRYYTELREPFADAVGASSSGCPRTSSPTRPPRRRRCSTPRSRTSSGSPARARSGNSTSRAHARTCRGDVCGQTRDAGSTSGFARHTPMQRPGLPDDADRRSGTTRRKGSSPPVTTIPQREVEDHFIPMRPTRTALYDRIETYISRYYNAYMTGPNAEAPRLHHDRLPAAADLVFLAIERSLQRRSKCFLARRGRRRCSTPTTSPRSRTRPRSTSTISRRAGQDFADEVGELDDFLASWRTRPPDESKMELPPRRAR